MVNGEKMSKSLGNFFTLRDLEAQGRSGREIRYVLMGTHYRKKLNFTFPAMDGAKIAYERLGEALLRHKGANAAIPQEKLVAYMKEFTDYVTDDLNIPGALGTLWTMLKETPSNAVYEAALKMDEVFGLQLAQIQPQVKQIEVPQDVKDLAERRLAAKQAKDWAAADALRAEITAKGYAVKDTKDGYTIEKL